MKSTNFQSKIFILLLSFSIFCFLTSCGDSDPRAAMLQKAIKSMSNNPPASDSISTTVKMILSIAKDDGFNVDKFKYFSDMINGNTLVLVRIPELGELAKDQRMTFLSIIDKMSDGSNGETKNKYIGIFGKKNLMMCKTPQGTISKGSVSNKELFSYYGEESVSKQ